MSIKERGTNTEYAIIYFLGNGHADMMNLDTGEIILNAKLDNFKADGGIAEIVREAQAAPKKRGET